MIGYTNRDNAVLLRRLFEAPYFRITLVNDVVSFCLMGVLGWAVVVWVLPLANLKTNTQRPKTMKTRNRPAQKCAAR